MFTSFSRYLVIVGVPFLSRTGTVLDTFLPFLSLTVTFLVLNTGTFTVPLLTVLIIGSFHFVIEPEKIRASVSGER